MNDHAGKPVGWIMARTDDVQWAAKRSLRQTVVSHCYYDSLNRISRFCPSNDIISDIGCDRVKPLRNDAMYSYNYIYTICFF